MEGASQPVQPDRIHATSVRPHSLRSKWASAYADEVTAVFGEGNVFADDNKNLLVARRVA